MRNFKFLIIFSTFLLLSKVAHSQSLGKEVARLFESSETSKPDKIDSEVTSVKKGDYEKLEKLDKGRTIYAPSAFSYQGTNIPQGLSMWNGTTWTTVYTATPAGSFRGDLEALHALQQHSENVNHLGNEINGVFYRRVNSWKIDLENINNPNNLKLNGVFFRKIDGEYRVEELRLDNFSYREITFTKGLEALVYFTMTRNKHLKKLNIKLPNLRYLNCNFNVALNEVTVDCATLAYTTFFEHYKITNITLKCLQLKELKIRHTATKSLDVTSSPFLEKLDCRHNEIEVLDLSRNIALNTLDCSYNKMSTLDVSKNVTLTSLDVSGNVMTTLDVTKNTALIMLTSKHNKMSTLDISKNVKLKTLQVEESLISKLDISNNLALIELKCSSNKLSTLDVSKNIALTKIDCSWNNISALDVSNNLELEYLYFSSNGLTSINLSRNTKLQGLNHDKNLFTEKGSIKVCDKAIRSDKRKDTIYEFVDCK